MTDVNKSIEELENLHPGEPAFDSYVVTTCHRARQKPIKLLSNEEIRCLIGQKKGLGYLLPIAVGILRKEPLTEAAFFEGDLLLAALRLDIVDWQGNESSLELFKEMLRSERPRIEACEEITVGLIEKYV